MVKKPVNIDDFWVFALERKSKLSFRTSEALHRMVYGSKPDLESRIFKQFCPPEAGGFRRDDGLSNFCKKLIRYSRGWARGEILLTRN